MDLKLKICGMRDPQNIEEIIPLQPDYMGLIFFEKSPRFVQDEIQQLDPSIKNTGVFVNASEEFILEKVKKYRLSAIQLHGDESPEFCRNLRKQLKDSEEFPELIKVFRVSEEFDFAALEPYEDVVDLYLFDTKGKNRGGNGIAFDWEVLEDYPSQKPFFLSGGIGPDEAKEIRQFYKVFEEKGKQHLFYGIDVNSKFENAPGLKNIEKLKLFRQRLFS